MRQGEEKGKLSLGWGNAGVRLMCDYSLQNVKTRPAQVGDTLTTRQFRSGTRGFAASEDKKVAVCLLPGTELAFTDEVRRLRLWPWSKNIIRHKTAIFRQINQDDPMRHHDALEFPDGHIVLLTFLVEGQQATVLQLPVKAGYSTGLFALASTTRSTS
jgi:hypothetical protein